jgi:hypothetical protein
MGLDEMLKQQIREHTPEVKKILVEDFHELSHDDLEKAGDDPDKIVDHIQKKTGQPREQVEQRVQKAVQKQQA